MLLNFNLTGEMAPWQSVKALDFTAGATVMAGFMLDGFTLNTQVRIGKIQRALSKYP